MKKKSKKTPAPIPQTVPIYLAAAKDALTRTLVGLGGSIIGTGWPTSLKCKVGEEEKELPVTYLDKDVIEVGDYVHTTSGQKIPVTAERIDHWVKVASDMLAAGLEIPTPVDHNEAYVAREKSAQHVSGKDNLGYVVAARKVDNRLRLTHQVIGEDAVATAMRNRASVCVFPEFKDEKGRVWKDAIMHSAYTPIPVVSGMGSFVPFAASRGHANQAPIFELAREQPGATMELKEDQKTKLHALAVENGKSVEEIAAWTDEELVAWYIDFSLGEGDAADDGTTPAPMPAQLSRAKARVKELETEVGTLKLSRGTSVRPLDPEAAQDRLLDVNETIDSLIPKGLKPATATKLKALAKLGDKPNDLMLSRNGGERYPMQALIEIVKEALDKPAPAPGTKTGPQSMVLSRETPGDTGDAEAKELKRLHEQAAAFGQKSNRRKTA